MATHVRHPAKSFAHSLEQTSTYNPENSHENDIHIFGDDAKLNDYSNTTSVLENQITDNKEPLCVHVERVVRQYFSLLGDDLPTDLYELILKEVERPLLSVVLEQTRGNQTKCAQILGLNRGTLRKKLKTYDLM